MSDIILTQNLTVSNLIKYQQNKKKARKNYIARKRKALLKLAQTWQSFQKQRRCPREWTFPRSSSFLEDCYQLPDEVFAKKFRFSKSTVEMFVSDLKILLLKQQVLREPITVLKRVLIGIYTLKSGADLSVVADVFGVSKTSVCRILDEFLNAMMDVYYKRKIKFPKSADDQAAIVQQFEDNWQFPGCIGSLDGTHIPILTQCENGGDYYNYKNWHSIIVLAIADAHYRFLWVNAGQPGKCSDGGAWEATSMSRNLDMVRHPYHLVADAAFPLTPKTLKPFPGDELSAEQRHFNYRLSRSRMTIESAFGRLKGRFRIFLKRCDWKVPKIVKCLITCFILHNIAEENNEVFIDSWMKKVEEFENIYSQPNSTPMDYHTTHTLRKEGAIKRNDLAKILST